MTPDCLFVALRGERTDGHRFVAQAVAAGAAAVLVEREVALPAGANAAIVRVADPLRAFQDLAAWWRDRFPVRVVGITGSTGKTLAKEVTADAKFGRGMEGVLRLRGGDFTGILNGLDAALWDPAKDPHLAKPFSVMKIAGRAACRADLQKAAGLEAAAQLQVELDVASRQDRAPGGIDDAARPARRRRRHGGTEAVVRGHQLEGEAPGRVRLEIAATRIHVVTAAPVGPAA